VTAQDIKAWIMVVAIIGFWVIVFALVEERKNDRQFFNSRFSIYVVFLLITLALILGTLIGMLRYQTLY